MELVAVSGAASRIWLRHIPTLARIFGGFEFQLIVIFVAASREWALPILPSKCDGGIIVGAIHESHAVASRTTSSDLAIARPPSPRGEGFRAAGCRTSPQANVDPTGSIRDRCGIVGAIHESPAVAGERSSPLQSPFKISAKQQNSTLCRGDRACCFVATPN